jgi:hypothetical protein
MTSAPSPPPDLPDPAIVDVDSDRFVAIETAWRAAEHRAQTEHAKRVEADARIAELEATVAALEEERAWLIDEVQAGSLPIFDGRQEDVEQGLAPDGSDPRLLGMGLAVTAIVAGLVTILALFNERYIFCAVMLIITITLAYWANATWVSPVEISVTRGVVYIDQGEERHRFDLRNDKTQVTMTGAPGGGSWEVRFSRKGMDSYVVRAGMVDAHRFVEQLREWRPEL